MTDEEIKAIEKLKWYFEESSSLDIAKQTYTVLNLIQKQQEEIEKKDYKIHIMQAEFERLENIEDNTDMLKLELNNKDKVIEELVDKIYRMDYRNEYGNTRNQIKENFYKKVEGK